MRRRSWFTVFIMLFLVCEDSMAVISSPKALEDFIEKLPEPLKNGIQKIQEKLKVGQPSSSGSTTVAPGAVQPDTNSGFPDAPKFGDQYKEVKILLIVAHAIILGFIFGPAVIDGFKMKYECPCYPHVPGYHTFHSYKNYFASTPILEFDAFAEFTLSFPCCGSQTMRGWRVESVNDEPGNYNFAVEPGDYILMSNCKPIETRLSVPEPNACVKSEENSCFCDHLEAFEDLWRKKMEGFNRVYHLVILRAIEKNEAQTSVDSITSVDGEVSQVSGFEFQKPEEFSGECTDSVVLSLGRAVPIRKSEGPMKYIFWIVALIFLLFFSQYLALDPRLADDAGPEADKYWLRKYFKPQLLLFATLFMSIANYVLYKRAKDWVEKTRGRMLAKDFGILAIFVAGTVLFIVAALFLFFRTAASNRMQVITAKGRLFTAWINLTLSGLYLCYSFYMKWRSSYGYNNAVQFGEADAGIILGIAQVADAAMNMLSESRDVHGNGGSCSVNQLLAAVTVVGPESVRNAYGGSWGRPNLDCPEKEGLVGDNTFCTLTCSDGLQKVIYCADEGLLGAQWSLVQDGEDVAKTFCCDTRPCPVIGTTRYFESEACTAQNQRVCQECSAANCKAGTTYDAFKCGGTNSGCVESKMQVLSNQMAV